MIIIKLVLLMMRIKGEIMPNDMCIVYHVKILDGSDESCCSDKERASDEQLLSADEPTRWAFIPCDHVDA